MKNHFKEQFRLLELAKKYLQKCKQAGIDISLSPMCFMTTWAKTSGHYKLKFLNSTTNFSFIIYFIKDLFSISYYHDLICSKNIKKKKINNLIISYCKKENFNKDGSFFDNYFRASSKNTNNVWFLISLDNFEPKNLKSNILIIKKKNKNSFSIFYSLNYLLIKFFKNFFSPIKFYHEASSIYAYAEKIKKIFHKFFKHKNIRNLILNYEGIPFQHGIIQEFKKVNYNSKVLCYLHCAGWPLQLDLIYRLNLIDKLVVSGNDQKNVLKKFLNWPDKKISIIPSLRFKKSSIKEYGGFIFVPFEISNFKKYLNKFDIFLESVNDKSLNYFKLRIHPLNKKSVKHKKFVYEIRQKIKLHKKKFSKNRKKNFSIIFGSATGVSIQSLEYGVKLYHIPDDVITDVFSNKIWPNINVIKHSAGLYEYSVKKKGNMFLENSLKNNFDKYLLPLTVNKLKNIK